MELPKDAQEKIQQLQLLEQNTQQLFMQKQQFQAQLLEYESAVKELQSARKAYKIVGNVMVAATPDRLLRDTQAKLDKTKLRIQTLEKQESKMKEKVQSLQKEVMGKM